MGRTKARLHTKTVWIAYRNGLVGLHYWDGQAFRASRADALPLTFMGWQRLYHSLPPHEQLHVAAYKEVVSV